MMYKLLKLLQKMPLTIATCEEFLLHTAMLAIVRELTTDDWVYLAHLLSYRITTRRGADDKDKAVMESALQRICEKQRLLNLLRR